MRKSSPDGYFNPKNDVVWADDRIDVNEHDGLRSMEKYPVCVMCDGCCWCDMEWTNTLVLFSERLSIEWTGLSSSVIAILSRGRQSSVPTHKLGFPAG